MTPPFTVDQYGFDWGPYGFFKDVDDIRVFQQGPGGRMAFNDQGFPPDFRYYLVWAVPAAHTNYSDYYRTAEEVLAQIVAVKLEYGY